MRPINFFMLAPLLLAVLGSEARAQYAPGPLKPGAGRPHEAPMESITVTGRVIRMMAIGGETTGWGLALDEPLQIQGARLKQIEIDPAGAGITGFSNRGVEITGILQQRSGIERKAYWVLVVKEIRGY